MATSIGEVSIELTGEEKDVVQALKKVVKELDKIEKRTKDIGKGTNKGADKMAKGFKEVRTSAEKTGKAIAGVGKEVKTMTKKASKDLSGLSDKIKGGLVDGIADGAKGLESAGLPPFIANLATAATKAGTLGIAIAGIGVAAAGIGSKLIELDNLNKDIQILTGSSKELADVLTDKSLDVYAKGFVESKGEAAELITLQERLFKDLGGADAETANSTAILAKYFDQSPQELLRTIAVLRRNFDGLSDEQALDVIASGFQDGLDFSGEYLDTLREYSPQFAALGLEADEFFSVLKSGTEGGAFNLDKLGDVMKEFNIRVNDGSKSTSEALGEIGLSAEDITRSIQENGVEEAFTSIRDRILEIENPMDRNRVAVALFGTQFEDLEKQVIESIDISKVKMEELDGTMTTINNNIENRLTTSIKSYFRELDVVLGEFLITFDQRVAETLFSMTIQVEQTIARIKLLFTVLKNHAISQWGTMVAFAKLQATIMKEHVTSQFNQIVGVATNMVNGIIRQINRIPAVNIPFIGGGSNGFIGPTQGNSKGGLVGFAKGGVVGGQLKPAAGDDTIISAKKGELILPPAMSSNLVGMAKGILGLRGVSSMGGAAARSGSMQHNNMSALGASVGRLSSAIGKMSSSVGKHISQNITVNGSLGNSNSRNSLFRRAGHSLINTQLAYL